MQNANLKSYDAWDINTRIFHWVNVACILVLSFLGLVMLNKGALGITGDAASIGLKSIHATIGFVFATNLIIRIIWGFLSDRPSHWSTILPGKGFGRELSAYRASLKSGQPRTFIGHSPAGRLSVVAMMLVMVAMMVTGTIRAGTDLYYPPLGAYFAGQVAAEGVPPSEIKPYDETGTDTEKLAELKAFKKPYGTLHLYGAYLLWLLVLVHLVAVIRADAGGQGTIISAMFTGKKHLPREPEDLQ